MKRETGNFISWMGKGIGVFGLTICMVSPAFSWGSTAHHIINLKGPMHLPNSMASLRADSLFFAAHASDADYRKNSSDTSFWAEGPRHFIDIDWYPNFHSLPHSLDSVIAMYGRSTVRNEGLNPWATVMVLDSLTAQLRRGDAAKVETTMSDLGHYVGDAHQPLHCANNYDGKLTGNGGIHSRYETAMINSYQNSITVHLDSVQYVSSPIDYIFNYIYHSNSYVDSILQADNYAKSVSGWNGSGTPPASYYTALWQKVGSFTIDQIQRATTALASLWYTAWVNAQPPANPFDSIFTTTIGMGTITPSGIVVVPATHDTTFVFAPQPAHHVDSVYVDGARVDSSVTYTFHNVVSNHTIVVWFGIDKDTVMATAGPNGSINPSGIVRVDHGGNQTFTFSPLPGYHVDSIIVDGTNQQSDTTYTLSNVVTNHSIKITFDINRHKITASGGSGGLIIPSGVINVVYGDSEMFVIRPDPGFWVDSVFVDGAYSGAETTFAFRNISADHNISVRFTDGRLSMQLIVADKWNLLSLPLALIDYRKSAVFTNASSNAFSYEGGYYPRDTLKSGAAYWVKFSGAHAIALTGKPIDLDTIPVNEGWNMLGSISSSVPVSAIASAPGGIITSSFFGYNRGYYVADSIRAGYGYWVKVSQAGQLILSLSHASSASSVIRIMPSTELPPRPPDGSITNFESSIPDHFALSQNTPNPFNPTTTVQLDLPVESHVTLELFNMLGQSVLKILDEDRAAGRYDVRIDGSPLTSGVYFYQVRVEDRSGASGRVFVQTRKMMLLK